MQENNIKIYKQSILSGILIGIGVVINLLSENKYIGALLFSFALLTIIQNGLPLYTGKIGFIKEYKITTLLKILVFNLAGVAVPVLMACVCKKDLYSQVLKVSDAKFSNNFIQLFLLGALCGILMFIAVYSKKEIITVFCIMIFILSGYEHCIADFPYIVLNPDVVNILKFVCIILGNSAGSIISYELMAAGTGKMNN